MKASFVGRVAARGAPGILGKMAEKLDATILADEGDAQRLIPALAEAELVVSHVWRPNLPPAPRLRLLQSATAGIDLIDLPSVPPGVTVCNVFGHEPAIAEYIMMTMLVLTHRLFDTVTAFRGGSWLGGPGGAPHAEILGSTIGILGYGRIGREVARRAVGFGCKVVAANRNPIADKGDASEIYPLNELDRMLPRCDALVVAAGLAPETRGLIDARRLALMKPTAVLINIGRAAIVDEEALYTSLKDSKIGGAALDVWWRYPVPGTPDPRPSAFPFHELPNVLMTPHCSSSTEATRERRWAQAAANLDRFVRREPLMNVVTTT
jgi:phosphoglycerate dehydrogenase-like enzyme